MKHLNLVLITSRLSSCCMFCHSYTTNVTAQSTVVNAGGRKMLSEGTHTSLHNIYKHLIALKLLPYDWNPTTRTLTLSTKKSQIFLFHMNTVILIMRAGYSIFRQIQSVTTLGNMELNTKTGEDIVFQTFLIASTLLALVLQLNTLFKPKEVAFLINKFLEMDAKLTAKYMKKAATVEDNSYHIMRWFTILGSLITIQFAVFYFSNPNHRMFVKSLITPNDIWIRILFFLPPFHMHFSLWGNVLFYAHNSLSFLTTLRFWITQINFPCRNSKVINQITKSSIRQPKSIMITYRSIQICLTLFNDAVKHVAMAGHKLVCTILATVCLYGCVRFYGKLNLMAYMILPFGLIGVFLWVGFAYFYSGSLRVLSGAFRSNWQRHYHIDPALNRFLKSCPDGRSAMIPLRNRESFFRDPFFSDCWDVMDRRRRDWEQEVNLSSKRFMNDLDDFELGGLQHHRGRMDRFFNRGSDLIDKDDLWKSSGTDTFGLQSDKENFKVLLDVQQFNPEELSVKTLDNTIVIEGKHEEKKDPHGLVSRHFTRQYTLPADVKVEDVQCNLSSDGVLHVTAPRVNPAITDKTGGKSSESQSRRSAERETATSTTKEYPDQRRTTSEQESATTTKKSTEGRRSAEREESRTSSKSSFGHLRDATSTSDRLRNRSGIFDSYFAGFPDFDLVPFWRRRDWSGGQGEIIERQSSHRNAMGVLSDRDNFKVQLDVSQFTPEELSVKTVDNFLVVEGKHEEKKDSLGYVTRHFTRKYEIPSDVKAEDVQCNCSSEGLLIVTAPRKRPQLTNEKVTVIPIKVKHMSGNSSIENKSSTFTASENGKDHAIRVEKQDTPNRVTNQNGVQIEEHISRSSSNQDARKEMNKPAPQEGIVSQPGEHIIPITAN